MTELGAGVDELQVDLLHGATLGVGQQRLSQGEDALLGSDATALEHDEVLLNLTVVGEAAHGVDGLVREIVLGRSVVLDQLKMKKASAFMQQATILFDLILLGHKHIVLR